MPATCNMDHCVESTLCGLVCAVALVADYRLQSIRDVISRRLYIVGLPGPRDALPPLETAGSQST